MPETVSTLLEIIGLGLIAIGVFLVSIPAGLIVLGIMLIAVSVAGARS